MTHENRALRIHAQRFSIVELGQLEPLLLVVRQTDAVPCVVVTRVDSNRGSETGQSLVQFLDHDVLVTQQGVGVREVGVDL